MPRYRCPICEVADNPNYIAMEKIKGRWYHWICIRKLTLFILEQYDFRLTEDLKVLYCRPKIGGAKMKTRKIKTTEIVQEQQTKEVEKEVIDREYYIEKITKAEKERGQLTIIIQGGVLVDVLNIPGETYTLIDWDELKQMSEKEFAEWVEHLEGKNEQREESKD
jgi:hypothetical protein